MKSSKAFKFPQLTTDKNVPLLDLSRQYRTIRDKMSAALINVNESGQFVLGPEVQKLETNVALYSRTKNGIGCASGSDALLLALMAVGIQPGDEVIVPSFTFFATASCVPRLGAVPVFADIDPVTFNLDPQNVEQRITSKTKAIIPVHLFGQMADMVAFRKMTKDHPDPLRQQIALIEDSAQAIGAELNNIPTGNWGDFACLSFYPTKNLGGAGDGGMLLTNNDDLANEAVLLRGHGMAPRYYHKKIGINSRLDSYQAAVLNVKLPYIDIWTKMRQQNAVRYYEMFDKVGLTNTIRLPDLQSNRRHVWNQFVIRIPDGLRNALREELTEHKIGTDIYYPLGLHQQECFQYLGYAANDLPETLRASEEVLALPIFPELRIDEQWTVVQGIKKFCDANEGRKVFPVAA
ncbi:MAG: DegT/DnrJ/EryC1/StrS family aminotransferase [Planctomycetia bacterium]|nr:DegT/DnrJ/EryC1/StrS family aminotransferase [Planctomycetia bacterium]